MTEITVLSGKGGTGKTSITAALATLAKNSVFCDNDVDAADLHLIFKPKIKKEVAFSGGYTATINEDKCTKCGLCESLCRFDAIRKSEQGTFSVNPYQCEGCRLCERACPTESISSAQSNNNFWYTSSTRFGPLVHAHMGPGEENSGKLVTQIRKISKEIARKNKCNFILNDGPPGIGCTTISSLSGTNAVLLVIEPSKTSLHDAKRLIELIQSFKIERVYALINKYDINLSLTTEIEQYLQIECIPILAKVPFDEAFVKAMLVSQSIIEYDNLGTTTKIIKSVWQQLAKTETTPQ
ncbi:ATP-binding protein [Saccharicrinis aurantiacus]|uniref:ATP-binding protein n=1 Tax=Saccharicrinis aurantiacus TaxID=1849719 RepID=UPI0024929323|nr:ATP-binding protein [Saccharicrinis aurantiacus]